VKTVVYNSRQGLSMTCQKCLTKAPGHPLSVVGEGRVNLEASWWGGKIN